MSFTGVLLVMPGTLDASRSAKKRCLSAREHLFDRLDRSVRGAHAAGGGCQRASRGGARRQTGCAIGNRSLAIACLTDATLRRVLPREGDGLLPEIAGGH